MIDNMAAVGSRSAFTERLAAVLGCKTKHDQSTNPSYTKTTLFTKSRGVEKTHDLVSKSDSDI